MADGCRSNMASNINYICQHGVYTKCTIILYLSRMFAVSRQNPSCPAEGFRAF